MGCRGVFFFPEKEEEHKKQGTTKEYSRNGSPKLFSLIINGEIEEAYSCCVNLVMEFHDCKTGKERGFRFFDLFLNTYEVIFACSGQNCVWMNVLKLRT